jgi:hypothetical protein
MGWSSQLQEDALARLGGAPRRIELQPSHLLRLAQSIQYAGFELSADFARAALGEMIFSYKEELEEVRIVAAGGGSQRYQSWWVATRAYLQRLTELLSLVDEGTPVSIAFAAPESVQLMIAGQPVIVQGPRLASPKAFERRIVDDFCLAHHCPAPTPREPLGSSRFGQPTQGVWSFSDSKGHAFETASGLRFVFHDLSERQRKQKLCLRLSEELRLLAAGLKSTRSKGVPIDWEHLEIVNLGRGFVSRVMLNERGDYFELKVPNLGRLPSLWKQATPWLQGQLVRETSEHFFSDADALLNPLLE